MADTVSAIAEIERRLLKSIKRDNGLLIVSLDTGKRSFSLRAIPATNSWEIRCSPTGIDLAFGGLVEVEISEGAGEASNVLNVQLTNSNLSEAQCNELVPLIGRKVLAFLR